VLTRLGEDARYVVRGELVSDGSGRTWAPVMTRTGKRGYVAAWATGFTGTARPRTRIVLRSAPSTGAHRLALVKAGVRVSIVRSAHDREDRAWIKVRTPSGRTGWIAAWLTRP
jgi:SH3-like domain-containing protein